MQCLGLTHICTSVRLNVRNGHQIRKMCQSLQDRGHNQQHVQICQNQQNSRWARNVLPKATKVQSQDYRKTSKLCWQMRIWLSGRYGACNLTLIDLRGDITYKAKCLQPGREGHDLQQPYSAAYCTQRSICFLGLGILPVCNKTWNHCNRSL